MQVPSLTLPVQAIRRLGHSKVSRRCRDRSLKQVFHRLSTPMVANLGCAAYLRSHRQATS